MAWADTMLDASFRGAVFDCLHTDDSVDIATASHEYPYLNGADVEDLGRKAKRIAMTAVFFGEGYEDRMNTFTKALKVPGAGELVHPVFGSIKDVQLCRMRAIHDADTPDYCTIELEFVVSTPSNPFFVQQMPAQKAAMATQQANAVRDAATSAFDKALGGLKTAKGLLGRLNALRGVLTATLGMVRGLVQGFITTGLDLLAFPRAFAADVAGLMSGLVDLRSFDRSSLMGDWGSLRDQLGGIVRLPNQTAGIASADGTVGGASSSAGASSGGSGSQTSGGTADSSTEWDWPTGTGLGSGGGIVGLPGTTSSPATVPTNPAPVKPEDVRPVTLLLHTLAAATLAETAGGILAAEADEPTLSPPQVESIINDVRVAVQGAIDGHRELLPLEDARPITEALKTLALVVQDAAVAVVTDRPPLITSTVEAPGNLHLVAFRWYGDYTRADELARLNPELRNPNALLAGDVLNAYAR